ncbi:MAG: MtrAB system histidine kinase MtrB [Arachnia sp.]
MLLTTLGASLAVLVLAGLFLLQQATTAIVETKKNAAISEAVGIYTFMQEQLRLPETRGVAIYEQLNQLAAQAGAQGGEYHVAIQGPASVLVSSGLRWESVPEVLREEVASGDEMLITPTTITYTTDEASEPGWAVGTTLIDTQGERFPVYYLFPMTNEMATLQALQRAVISTGLVLLVALAAVAYLVTVQIVRPVRRASQTALRLASGHLDDRLMVRGTDDIASLAESMNLMADDLQQRIRDLERLSLVQRRFVSDVSHELRTPLTPIQMAAEVLHDERDELLPHAARTVELMHTEIDRFDVLLADLLEISRFDAGAAVLTLEETDLAALVSSEVEIQQAFAASLGTRLRLRVKSPATAEVDPRRIRRILRNLLTNAIEHAERKPIEVTVAADDEAAAVTVRDRGVGFLASQSGQVFERFWRADPSRTRIVGGSGLGLSIALEDAKLHGGWLTAWGRPGQGAQFRLTLPRDPETHLRDSPLPASPAEGKRR